MRSYTIEVNVYDKNISVAAGEKYGSDQLLSVRHGELPDEQVVALATDMMQRHLRAALERARAEAAAAPAPTPGSDERDAIAPRSAA